MENAHGPSIGLSPPDPTHTFAKRRLIPRPHPQTQSLSGRVEGSAMPIPGTRLERVPPALPPPRFDNDLANGHDISWQIQNHEDHHHHPHSVGRLPPIKPGSSLFGGSSPQLERDKPAADSLSLRRSDAHLSLPPASLATGISLPILSGRSPPPSGISQKLQGENPLAQQNHYQSTNAYDKHLLNKIGKTHSPSHTRHNSANSIPLCNPLSTPARGLNLYLRPVHEPSHTVDLNNNNNTTANWVTSPMSGSFSPGTRSAWPEYIRRSRSPSRVGTTPHDRQREQPPLSLSCLQPQRTPEIRRSRSERDSFDSGRYSGDHDRRWEESRHHIEERPRHSGAHSFKRRALLPSLDTNRDLDHYHNHQHTSSLHRRQPIPSFDSHQPYASTSHSADASSVFPPSHTSSNLYSHAPSSLTSASSIDTRFACESAPSSFNLSQPTLSPASAITPLRRPQDLSISSRMSSQALMNDGRAVPAARIPNQYVCTCCPKKPRKFDTEEKLRNHENEKQYTCAYCNNRFKNKNEAERHQNSLHLRKYSWSCSAIASPQNAFYPSSTSSSSSSSDICGFCGQEFSNTNIDWNARYEHLSNVHKFGECNLGKKFYRADHFRQHLKHSHGGRSGKWTNILEANCLKEEAMSESPSQSPTVSENSASGSGTKHTVVTNPSGREDESSAGVDAGVDAGEGEKLLG